MSSTALLPIALRMEGDEEVLRFYRDHIWGTEYDDKEHCLYFHTNIPNALQYMQGLVNGRGDGGRVKVMKP